MHGKKDAVRASAPGTNARTGGKILADQLARFGVETIYCVPGESFLGLLDGLYDHRETIRVVTCRHEGGAANMADAHSRVTGRPGVCAVTRGPGATNASNGVHTAYQDSRPMILLIGQVGRDMMDREAFQEMDYRRMFGQMAKWVAQIESAARIPEYLSRAWQLCQAGRPGPVVLALPEDMLSETAIVDDAEPARPAASAPNLDAISELGRLMEAATAPLLVVGGPGWSAKCAAAAEAFARRTGLPIATTFRCQDYVDNACENYAGVLGIAPVPSLRARVREDVDLLITLGARLGEMTTQGYTLIDIPNPRMTFVHIHPDPAELGQVYRPDLAIASTAANFWDAASVIADGDGTSRWADWRAAIQADQAAYRVPTDVPGDLNMARVMAHISETMPKETIITNGAGNYTVWAHRFHQHRAYPTQVAPTSGSMGYAVPAAVAAKLAAPEAPVICYAGDGCFLMTAQEMATARQYGAAIIYLVVNNGMLGTIRMHQERAHPRRVIATDLVNPDFVHYAKAFGVPGERLTRDGDFPAALDRARSAPDGYLIELVVDPEAITPSQSITDLRGGT